MKLVIEMDLSYVEFYGSAGPNLVNGEIVADHLNVVSSRLDDEVVTIGDEGEIFIISSNEKIGFWRITR